MKFLNNIKIKTKIQMLIVPMALMGAGAVGYISMQYKDSVTKYYSFVTEDSVAASELFRATTNVINAPYSVYQMLHADGSVDSAAVKKSYDDAKSTLVTRMDKAAKLTPEIASELTAFKTRAIEIFALSDQAVAAIADGNKDKATKLLAQADNLANRWREDMRGFNNKKVADLAQEGGSLNDGAMSTITSTLVGVSALFIGFIALASFLSGRGITQPLERLRERMTALAGGKTEEEVPGLDRGDEVGQMAQAVGVFRDNALAQARLEADAAASRSMTENERRANEEQRARNAAEVQFAVDNLANALQRLSDGDVAFRIDQPFAGQLDVVRGNYNASAQKLQDALVRVAQNARAIDAGANEIRGAADDLAKRTEQQAASVEETAAALEQITTAVKDSTSRAQEAGALVSRTKDEAERSGEVVRRAVVAMEQIEKSSSEISNIISVIDEIAFQTNLLALNAGVEAARAGEAGKGFAVVAQEVRELAQRSASAAKDIKTLINASNEHVESGVSLVGQTGEALTKIASEVLEINRHVTAIVEAAHEQSSGLQQINTSVNHMDQDTQKNAAMVEESNAASHALAKESASLAQLLSQFNLGTGQTSAASAPAPAPRSVRETERPAVSPARKLGNRVAAAFSGNAALATSKENWEEF
ncbi:methyl-accepting chemotaxis protein [Rhizobium helianthi]|uniref:Methyl-accepting chemotaxis protein n=1 Tax=Rhizobium helianthi TaxID=1132695 RepID=A0ABW4LXJ8_9HYPH